jgi:hypothetical protein
MALTTKGLALRAHSPHANYRLARAMAQLNRPFSVGKIYLERALRGDVERTLQRIASDWSLLVWRRDPAFARWLRRARRR